MTAEFTAIPPSIPPAPPSPAVTRTKARIIGLDGARGLSCMGVAIMHVTGHYSPHTSATWKTNLVGLSLIFFYVLSGFLLFLPYVRKLTEERGTANAPSAANFAMHRVARILPGYLAIFLICNFVFQIVYVQNPSLQPLGTEDGTGMITDPWQLLANLTLVQSYIPEYFQTGLNPSWSLTLEYAFYVSVPLLGALLFALRKRTSTRPLMLALLAPVLLITMAFIGRSLVPMMVHRSGITDRVLLDWGPNWIAVFTKTFLTNADTFAMGMLAAVVIVAMEQFTMSERVSRRVRLYSVLAIIPGTALFLWLLASASQFVTSGIALVCGLMILVIVAPLARGEDSAIARHLDSAPLRFIGKVSLSAYLWHFPLMLLLGRWGLMAGDSVPGMFRNVVVVLTVTLLVSAVTYYLVEQPAMNWAKRYRARWA
ncbi:acyltransferase [Mycobacterium sp.]|uniref:acyltransferase family protein n=1 Tax=Mycobacterium sp. TaxID=1785 RepID=UPI002C1CF9EC|nr:acyltransferase [Mycobacterium sp.]HKP40999.1 acyltransferase [Mycobacterium sp.]